MKKTKMFLYILFIILALLCCSCGFFGNQKYICKIDEVKSVQIVKLNRYVEGEYRYEYTFISQVSDYESFVSHLNELDHSINWGDPQQLDVQYIVIKIDYRNGDFDLIHPDAQWFNRSGANQSGYFFFDDEQFDKLISEYI